MEYTDSVGLIKPKCIDECVDTIITIACHRETSRLHRMLRVFEKAMMLAQREGKLAKLRFALCGLHDHKGLLTAVWSDRRSFFLLQSYVDEAWVDEGEHLIEHKLAGGTLVYSSEDEPIKLPKRRLGRPKPPRPLP